MSTDRRSEDRVGVLVALLETGINRSPAADSDPLAPSRIPALLALEVETGRPRLPRNIRELIAQMAKENPTWGQGRVASELSLKLGIQVSPRTVRAYWPWEPDGRCRGTSSHHWQTFVRNQARSIVACDFLVAVTARFRVLYVLVVMEVGTRRILHCNVTAHPSAAWTLQQFREAIPSDHRYKFLLHDRHAIFSPSLDEELRAFGVRALRTPVRTPQANA